MVTNDGEEPLGAMGQAILDLAPKMAEIGAEEVRLEHLGGGKIGVSIRYVIDPGPGDEAESQAVAH